MDINILLFDGFETLDVFGPVEIFGKVEEFRLHYFSQHGGTAESVQGVRILTEPIDTATKEGVLVVPGGNGTRTLVQDGSFLKMLRDIAEKAQFCLSVCTGSALLAKAGLLTKRYATSNKRAFSWVITQGDDVHWVEIARWVTDGKFYTSSGVSAGMDMALGFVKDCLGEEKAEDVAYRIEYLWNKDPHIDPFAVSGLK